MEVGQRPHDNADQDQRNAKGPEEPPQLQHPAAAEQRLTARNGPQHRQRDDDRAIHRAAAEKRQMFLLLHAHSPFVQVKQAMPFTVSSFTQAYRLSNRSLRLSKVSKGGVKKPLGT